jgi:hypothetical protein
MNECCTNNTSSFQWHERILFNFFCNEVKGRLIGRDKTMAHESFYASFATGSVELHLPNIVPPSEDKCGLSHLDDIDTIHVFISY